MIKHRGILCPQRMTRSEFDGCRPEGQNLFTFGEQAAGPSSSSVSSKIDYCPFSVLVRIIAHEVSGGRGGYRNHIAITKAEAQDIALWFRGCFSHDNLFKVCWKTFSEGGSCSRAVILIFFLNVVCPTGQVS